MVSNRLLSHETCHTHITMSHNISRGLFFDVSKTTLGDSLLCDLAGNAFASPCVAAAIFAIYAAGGA